jgi:hypothetical protein
MYVQDRSRVVIEVLAVATPSAVARTPSLHSAVGPRGESSPGPLHVPLVKAGDLIQLALALVGAQACLAQAASDFAMCKEQTLIARTG